MLSGGLHQQALLLERRILMVATDSDRVSAAVHAAVALIFPFRWQHIYLPLLPHVLQVCCTLAACPGHSPSLSVSTCGSAFQAAMPAAQPSQ